MSTRKVITGRNPRVSFTLEELDYLKSLVDKDITKNQKLDKDKMLFQLTVYKKFDTAK